MWEYRCYKRDTGVMLEWLEKTAALCDWRAPPAIQKYQTSPQVTSSVGEPHLQPKFSSTFKESTQATRTSRQRVRCSGPSTFFFSSIACRCISSPASYLP